MANQDEVKTEPISIKAWGKSWGVPMTWIGSTLLGAAGSAYLMVQSSYANLKAADERNAAEIAEVRAKLDTEQVVLAEIRAQLARIDARVAEVQVVLMQAAKR